MYTIGTTEQVLTWKQVPKEGVQIDARKDERFRPTIKSGNIKDINTPYKMVKVMMPHKWLTRMERCINQRLTGLNHKNRKTTIGECERLCTVVHGGAGTATWHTPRGCVARDA